MSRMLQFMVENARSQQSTLFPDGEKYTGQSMRKTTATRLRNSGFDDSMMMSVTDHRDASSIPTYASTSSYSRLPIATSFSLNQKPRDTLLANGNDAIRSNSSGSTPKEAAAVSALNLRSLFHDEADEEKCEDLQKVLRDHQSRRVTNVF